MNAIIIIAAVVIVILGYAVFLYNSFISARNKVEESFAIMDVLLKKRFDLVPQLVAAVKGYSAHEADTLVEVTRQRNPAAAISDKITAENRITESLNNLNVTIEKYPELKANENFLKLQQQLVDIEDELMRSRRYFNGCIRQFNDKVSSFPSSIMANIMGLKTMPMFVFKEG